MAGCDPSPGAPGGDARAPPAHLRPIVAAAGPACLGCFPSGGRYFFENPGASDRAR